MGTIFNSVGVMTGTSSDGADFSTLEIEIDHSQNVVSEKLGPCFSISFPEKLRTRILSAQSGKISLKDYGKLQLDFSLWLSLRCREFLTKNKLAPRKTILAIHGQTVWHEPPARSPSFEHPGYSIQMIDAALIAQRTGFVTVSHFRQPDLALGGQGAPLVPFYHWLRVRQSGAKIPVAIHNIGGIANLTYVSERAEEIFAFDTGPGNALIDLAIQAESKNKQFFDEGGKFAKTQNIDWKLIQKLARESYFRKIPPKSTGREIFNQDYLRHLKEKGSGLTANATALTAVTMAEAYINFIFKKKKKLNGIYLSGGGSKNSYLVSLFKRVLAEEWSKEVQVEVIPDSIAPAAYLEAMAFARLGAEAILGRRVSMPEVTGAVTSPSGAAIFQSSSYVDLCKALYS